jgi:hypothetical protein
MGERTDLGYLNSRSYVVNNANYNAVLVPGPCILDAICTTNLGDTDYNWQLYDGLTAGGTVIAFGKIQPMQLNSLRIPISTGLFFSSNGTGVVASWLFVVKLVAPPGV